MSTRAFVRKPRITPPRMPGGEVDLQPPPEIPRVVPGGMLGKLMPVVMVVSMLGMVGLMFTSGVPSNPTTLLFPAMMVVSMLGMLGSGGRGNGKKAGELNEERKDYFRYLGQVCDEVRLTGEQQRDAIEWSHPDPRTLIGLVGGRRMWERRAADPDFCNVRLGFGHQQRLATKLASPETGPLEDLEPIASVSLRRFVRTHSVVHGLATAVSLRGFAAVSVEGDRAQARALVRSMVCQLSTFQGPDHVLVAVITSNPDGPEWAWTKWLPHNQHPSAVDGLGSARLVFSLLGELESALAAELEPRGRFSRNASPTPGQPQLVVVFDDGFVDGDERILVELGLDAVTVVDLAGEFATIAARRGLQLMVADGQVGARTPEGIDNFGTADQMSTVQAEVLARSMASYRVATAAQVEAGDEGRSVGAGLMGLLGIPDAAAIDPEVVWRPRSARERLRVPIGVDPNGAPVEIDIKEAAENGMGPHGLCIGATGSGKSEFLRTLVLGMITTHSPDALNLVLVDFKGGATFLGLDGAPHVAAVITNLEEELSMVDRMKDALSGEMNRRQELLRAAGNFANVTEYEKARTAGAALDPLPALFVVVDEFSELLSQKPEFADLFVAIGRLGRSLHMHLLLASQRLEEGKLRGLDSHLSYRIGLKTFSANESRTVLGVPDAYHLPSVPGSGYLKCDSADPIRFNASYVSGPYSRVVRRITVDGEEDYGDTSPKLFTAAALPVAATEPVLAEPDEPEEVEERTETKSLLDVVVDRLRGHGRPAHQVWLDPLDESSTLNMLLPDPDWRSPRNRHGAVWAPIGMVDRPYDQRRDVLTVDLSGAQGHLAVVGGPQAGKSTALRTLIMSMGLTHTPEQVQFYCLDFGGGTLTGLADLPHVGSVAGRLDQDRVRRTVAEVAAVVRQREERFRELGIDSMREFRRRKAAALTAPDPDADPVTADPFGDVFLVVDGWGVVRQEYEALEPQITALAGQGLSYGVHVVLGASRWAEIRPALKDLIGTKIELRLGDPADSEMARRLADLVPLGRPGRGLTRDGLHMLIGLPRIDSRSSTDDLVEGVADAIGRLGTFWDGHRAPPVRMLPDLVPREQILAQAARRFAGVSPEQQRLRVPIGIDEAELAPVCIDFAVAQNFLAFADSESGKTTLLRNICMGLMEANTSQQVKIILADYRRTMLGVVEGGHLAGYAASADQLTKMVAHLCEILAGRMAGPNITQQQMRERSWWSGPEIFLVVDDYDMVATASGNPLAPLVDFLASARDVGLHLVIARRSGGASRAMFDPVIGRLKDLSVDGLVMNGSRDEGNLLGTVRPSALPPGRGTLVTRARGAELVQVSYLPPL
ncbi:type VII secretion protein EccCa [Rhodococcus sp. D2-41]|uniref:type VII secretion protein EccCa n=1 Tax=Speluncibacter jeojiensis TaxID=2710754 RepID=UPI002410814F|nr:type VII secretion protein EccCa [Rhodococcus sp. D2-41]MDG3010007.1 type VII secretion protein EccCa [Rhodococcus sp. D2-41]